MVELDQLRLALCPLKRLISTAVPQQPPTSRIELDSTFPCPRVWIWRRFTSATPSTAGKILAICNCVWVVSRTDEHASDAPSHQSSYMQDMAKEDTTHERCNG